jgi:hypothetical protein
MATTLQKIQDAAGRIARLGRYVSPSGQTGEFVERDKGAVFMASEGKKWLVVCIPREGRVWLRSIASGEDLPDLNPEDGLQTLLRFEAAIKQKAEKQALDEVLAELVERKIRRITKPKTRGFKADQKKLKKRPVQGTSS